MPSLDAALLASPLNRLPPEVRNIIYSILLTQPSEILISYKRFRSCIDRHGLFPNICMYCEYLILTLFLLVRQQGALVEEKTKVQDFGLISIHPLWFQRVLTRRLPQAVGASPRANAIASHSTMNSSANINSCHNRTFSLVFCQLVDLSTTKQRHFSTGRTRTYTMHWRSASLRLQAIEFSTRYLFS